MLINNISSRREPYSVHRSLFTTNKKAPNRVLLLLVFLKLFLVKGCEKFIISALAVNVFVTADFNNSVCHGLYKLVVVGGEQYRFGITDKSVVESRD